MAALDTMPNVFSAAPTTAPTTAPDSPPPTLDLNMDAQGMHPASPGGSTQCFFDSDDEEDRLVLEDDAFDAQMWQAPGSPAPTQYGDEEQLVEEEAEAVEAFTQPLIGTLSLQAEYEALFDMVLTVRKQITDLVSEQGTENDNDTFGVQINWFQAEYDRLVLLEASPRYDGCMTPVL